MIVGLLLNPRINFSSDYLLPDTRKLMKLFFQSYSPCTYILLDKVFVAILNQPYEKNDFIPQNVFTYPPFKNSLEGKLLLTSHYCQKRPRKFLLFILNSHNSLFYFNEPSYFVFLKSHSNSSKITQPLSFLTLKHLFNLYFRIFSQQFNKPLFSLNPQPIFNE